MDLRAFQTSLWLYLVRALDHEATRGLKVYINDLDILRVNIPDQYERRKYLRRPDYISRQGWVWGHGFHCLQGSEVKIPYSYNIPVPLFPLLLHLLTLEFLL